MSAEASQELSTICERDCGANHSLAFIAMIWEPREAAKPARRQAPGTVLNINQINMNISVGSNFERMAHTSYHAAANDDNLQIVEVLVLDALESAHRITGRTLNNQDHRKSRMRTTSNQVFRPLDS